MGPVHIMLHWKVCGRTNIRNELYYISPLESSLVFHVEKIVLES